MDEKLRMELIDFIGFAQTALSNLANTNHGLSGKADLWEKEGKYLFDILQKGCLSESENENRLKNLQEIKDYHLNNW